MIHPTPPGTRDVLPDEMRELRALTERLSGAFERAGYGEVWTPALEYEDVLRTGDERSAGAGYRLFDEHGEVLALRSDGTIPIARLVATRYADVQPPIRLCYFAHAYRAPQRGTGQLRDRLGIGDGSLYRQLLRSLEVPEEEHLSLLERLARRDLAGLSARLEALDLAPRERELLTRLPELRGGPKVLDRADGPAAGAVEGLRALHELLAQRGVADRVIFDLGLVRELGYYTGAVFEVYDPAVGFALGGGGRYDELLGRFGRPLPACGIALDVQRVHVAQAEEERQA